jgi:flagellar biosynthesis protein FlhG
MQPNDSVWHVPATAQHARAPHRDQAQGLRRLFAGAQVCPLALVANPHVAFSSVMLERLTTALSTLGLNTLVVDAADNSPAAHELAALDLRACIEPLSAQVSYLAARGLPLRHVDTHGSSSAWLDRLATAVPQVQVMLVHASAADLARLFTHQPLRPVLLAADHPHSVTHAYAAMKLLAMRRGLMSFDLLLAAPPKRPRVSVIARRLASCAESFLGAAVREWVAIDPACDVREAPGAPLLRLVCEQVRAEMDNTMDGEAATVAPLWPRHTVTRERAAVPTLN